MFEHYTDDDDMSFKIVQSPHLSSRNGDKDITWTIDTLADSRYIDAHRDTMRIIIYKESTYGKNPYYDGPLSALATSTGEWTKLYYTKGAGDTSAEVSVDSVVIAGTYDVYKNSINASESNELYNIDEVAAQYDSGTKLLKLQFKKIKSDLSSWIAYHDINVIVIDERDLRVYAQYHFFDPTAYLTGNVHYDFKKEIAYDERKF